MNTVLFHLMSVAFSLYFPILLLIFCKKIWWLHTEEVVDYLLFCVCCFELMECILCCSLYHYPVKITYSVLVHIQHFLQCKLFCNVQSAFIYGSKMIRQKISVILDHLLSRMQKIVHSGVYCNILGLYMHRQLNIQFPNEHSIHLWSQM